MYCSPSCDQYNTHVTGQSRGGYMCNDVTTAHDKESSRKSKEISQKVWTIQMLIHEYNVLKLASGKVEKEQKIYY